MTEFETLLHHFFGELVRIDTSFVERLSPPASKEDIEQLSFSNPRIDHDAVWQAKANTSA
jgi:hypothetical protein